MFLNVPSNHDKNVDAEVKQVTDRLTVCSKPDEWYCNKQNLAAASIW